MKKVYLIHGWGGTPKGDWYMWFAEEMRKREWEVEIPEMPDTMKPKIEEWVSKIKEIVKEINEDTYLVGHSIGCQAIMRYLETLDSNLKIGGCCFVAGWFSLSNETWDDEYTKKIADPWINTPIDFKKIKSHCDKFVDIFSNNDPYVPVSDSKIFEEKLGAKIISIGDKGHICGEEGTTQLPILVNELLKMLE